MKLRLSVICGLFLVTYSSTLPALPLNCVANTEQAPFLTQLLTGGTLEAELPAQETFGPLLERALVALDTGARPNTVLYAEAEELGQAALGCLHRSEKTANPDKSRLALSYIAMLALSRSITNPQYSDGATLRAERLLGLARSKALNGIAEDGRYDQAAKVLSEMQKLASRLAGSRQTNAVPIRESVDRILAKDLVPGSRRMEDHLEDLYAPIKDRLDLLVSIALTRESARGLIEAAIARPADSDLVNGTFSNQEHETLEHMRTEYARLFPDDDDPQLSDGAPERLLRLRATLEARGVNSTIARHFCMGKLSQADCLSYDGALFANGGSYPDTAELDAMVPLALIDTEMRAAVTHVLQPFVGRFDDGPPKGTVEELREVEHFLVALAESDPARRPQEIDAYIENAGKSPLRPDLFVTEGQRSFRINLCKTAPDQAQGPPRFGAGTSFIEAALGVAERFIAPGMDPNGSLKQTCEFLGDLAKVIGREKQ